MNRKRSKHYHRAYFLLLTFGHERQYNNAIRLRVCRALRWSRAHDGRAEARRMYSDLCWCAGGIPFKSTDKRWEDIA